MTFNEYHAKLGELVELHKQDITETQEKIKALEAEARERIKDLAERIEGLRSMTRTKLEKLNELMVMYYKVQGVVEYVDGTITIADQTVPDGGSDSTNVSEG